MREKIRIELGSASAEGRFMEYSHLIFQGGYRIDDQNRPAVREIFDTIFKTKPKKGLMVYGRPGIGKTILFYLLQPTVHPKNPNKFQIRTALDVVIKFNTMGHQMFRDDADNDVMYDDLGAEKEGKFYGDQVNVFEKLIQFRYDLYCQKGIRTYFTTNLKPEQLEEKYGFRCYSRLKEMCNHVVLPGTDRRGTIERLLSGYPPVIHKRIKDKETLEFELMYEKQKQEAKKNPPKPDNTIRGLGSRIKEAFRLGLSTSERNAALSESAFIVNENKGE